MQYQIKKVWVVSIKVYSFERIYVYDTRYSAHKLFTQIKNHIEQYVKDDTIVDWNTKGTKGNSTYCSIEQDVTLKLEGKPLYKGFTLSDCNLNYITEEFNEINKEEINYEI